MKIGLGQAVSISFSKTAVSLAKAGTQPISHVLRKDTMPVTSMKSVQFETSEGCNVGQKVQLMFTWF